MVERWKRGAVGANWGRGMGRGFPLPNRLGGLGERREFPQRPKTNLVHFVAARRKLIATICLIYVSLNTAVVHSHYCFERCKKYNNVIAANRLSIYGMLVMYASRKPLLRCAGSCNQSTLVPKLLCRIVGVIWKYFGNCHKKAPTWQVAAPCNVIRGSGMTCHWIRQNVRHIGIWFRFRPHHRSRHVILHQSPKFYPNRTTSAEKNDIMSIFKMADLSHHGF